MSEISISRPSLKEFEQICHHAVSFKLDRDDLHPEQFIIARMNDKLSGFVRIKKHADCTELSTLGILPDCRNRGIGALLVNRLLKETVSEKIHLLTIIPEYFLKLGFKPTEDIPASLKPKKEDCKIHCCTDSVTAMVFENKNLGTGNNKI